ncbi:HDIG domain-containing protein [Puniceicoccaceae bacterium K14]|nr:HDIG domain-containing protein [Puniceicoccaceae bacterium K14]
MPVSEQIRAFFQKHFQKKRMRKTETSSSFLMFLEESRAISFLVFVLTVLAIVLTSFVGIRPSAIQVLPNQVASIRIIASDGFSYPSKILTAQRKEQLLNEVPHVYRIDLEPYETFNEHVRQLLSEMRRYSEIERDISAEGAERFIRRSVEDFNLLGNYRLSQTDLTTILDYADHQTRRDLINTGLISLRESYKLGIYDQNKSSFTFGEDSVALFHIAGQEGGIGQRRIETIQEALTSLQIVLNAQNVPPSVSASVIRLFRDGLKPNLVKDESEMETLRQEMLNSLEPVIVQVQKGASIIEPDTKVTAEQHEQYVEYRRYLHGADINEIDSQLTGRVLLVLAMLIAATFYFRMEDRATLQSNGRLGLLSLVVVCNLAFIRFCFELSNLEFFIYDGAFSSIVPYITPTMLAPVIVAILIGTGPGFFTALMISLFTAVMFGNRLDLLVMYFLSSAIAIFLSRKIRKRGRVVASCFWAGTAIALFTMLFNWVAQLPWSTITNQMLGGLITGLAEGVVIVGLLPILEGLFKRTTDITLLELSDYNHPLLSRMQLEAPGTWHHSLMVANLAENACNAINTNGLMARVACMFHDIGKLVKPGYFTENQRDGNNPHDEKSPSFSALVIKSHVKEGVNIGLTYKLPRPVIDVIRQHHGTNLIRFFYHKAIQQAEAEGGTSTDVHESTYRYDGPKPQTKENAVILIADSLEAASRSLHKVTPNNVEELVDRIMSVNIEDGQLDESPITLSDLSKIRESFIFTILNSLHSRIAYPGGKENKVISETSKPSSTQPTKREPLAQK